MHPQPTLSYLVADGARARLLVRHGDGRYSALAQFDHSPARHDGRGDAGRVYSRTRPSHAATGEPDRSVERRRFAAELAAAMERHVASGEVARLVLVAPPRLLNDIRRELPGRVARVVAGELPKDLTKLPEAQLRETLDNLAWAGTTGAPH